LKNSGKFGFGISKNIKIDTQPIPIKHFAFYSHFEAPFQPPDEADLKNNGRFGFGTPKSTKIDI